MALIEVKNAVVNYEGDTAVSGASFSVEKADYLVVLGENGSGKSSVMKAMLGLVRPDAGDITCFGKPFAGNEKELKQRLGYSTGTLAWYPGRKIREIAQVVRRFYGAWDENAYEQYLRLFALDPDKRASELSEGMKVKCNLLFALSHHAEVLILDEPTSALDPFSRDELTEVFRELKARGTAVFFSTHIVSDLEKCADRILYISSGEIRVNLSMKDFAEQLSLPGETLEETVLRLERSAKNA